MKFHNMSGKPRHAYWSVVTSGVLLGAAAMCAAGCHTSTCEETLTCPPLASAGSGGAGSGGAGSGGAGSGGGGGSFNCDPTILKEVDNSCGIWVTSGEDTNSLHPHATTLGEAITKLAPRAAGEPKNVYACIETFKENVTLPEGVTLWGALDCNDNWKWHSDNPKAVLMPPDAMPDSIPLTVQHDPNYRTGSGIAAVVDFIITADSATVPGGSSIAVAVDTATATFTRCDLSAGDAMAGDAGLSGGAQMVSTLGMNGVDGGIPVAMGSAMGGAIGTNMCGPNGIAGGQGGAGAPPNTSSPGGMGDTGDGGLGGHGDMGQGCADGEDGVDGDKDQPLSSGASGAGIGDITMSGYSGADGDPGAMGHNGTSGGGGGGKKATVTMSGAGGGGGGAGGCGGMRGEGGHAGGSSIALLSWSGNVTMSNCTLKAGTGGDGGAGGAGQPGQLGGSGGKGGADKNGSPGCTGGKGGSGGKGSDGGGGQGGHSLGVAMKNGTLNLQMDPSMLGTPGNGGLAKDCWDFTIPQVGSACTLLSGPPQ